MDLELEGNIRVEQDNRSTTQLMTDSYDKNKFYLFFLLNHTVLWKPYNQESQRF